MYSVAGRTYGRYVIRAKAADFDLNDFYEKLDGFPQAKEIIDNIYEG